MGVYTSLNQMLLDYYTANNINLDTRLNLLNINYYYDDDPIFLHLPQHFQENILDDSGTRIGIEYVIGTLIGYPIYHDRRITITPIINNITNTIQIHNEETSNLTNLNVNCEDKLLLTVPGCKPTIIG